jgi:YD repeat-containing protein
VVDVGGLALRTCYTYDDQGNKVSETSPRGTSTSCP